MHDGKQPPIEYSRLIAYDSKGNTVGKRQIASRNKAEVNKYTDSWMKNNPYIAIVEIEHVNDYPSGGIIVHATKGTTSARNPMMMSADMLIDVMSEMTRWIKVQDEEMKKELRSYGVVHGMGGLVDAIAAGIPHWMLRKAIKTHREAGKCKDSEKSQ